MLFFFSSRRRHTRYWRDWSSDVCSSDLVDREEITVVGRIPEPAYAEGASEAEKAATVEGRIKEFRERTRDARMAVARDAQHKFERKVSWGVRCGDQGRLFTHLSVPVMTRLQQ